MADGIKKISENVIIPNRALVITNPTEADNLAIEVGALKSDSSKRGLQIKTGDNLYSNFDAQYLLLPGSIGTSLLKDGCVTTPKLANSAVTEVKLATNSVSEIKLQSSCVTNSKIAFAAVNEFKIADNSIKESHIKNSAVSNDKIANNTINNSKLLNKTITNSKIADGTISNSLLANSAVTNSKLAVNSVANKNLQDGCIYGNKIKNLSVENKHLAPNSVNSQNMLNGSVISGKIANNNIKENHIADKQIFNRHLADNAVTNRVIADNSVTTNKIVNKAITSDKLSDDVLDLIGDPVQYDQDDNVTTRNNVVVKGNLEAKGTITATKIFNAVFMDLAEGYVPNEDDIFVPGDIVEVREDGLLYKADNITENKTIVGVVSAEYAACYGATEEELANEEKIAVGLIGKVHVNIVGPIKIGEYVTAMVDGLGASSKMNLAHDQHHIIGKALETNTDKDVKKVLCQIFPN